MHMCVNNLLRVVTWSWVAGTWNCDLVELQVRRPNLYATCPQRHMGRLWLGKDFSFLAAHLVALFSVLTTV